jgi:hypothetical protein
MKKLIKYKFIYLSACSSEESSAKIIFEGGLTKIEKTIEKPKFLEKERLEKEEKERLEKERLEKEEKERLEKERLEKEEKERLEKERLEKEEKERLEKERLEKERLEKEEKERFEKEEKERLEKEEKEKKEEKDKKEKEEKERLFEDLKKNIENQKEKDHLEDIFENLDPDSLKFFEKEKENIKGIVIDNHDAIARELEPGIWFYGNSGLAIKNYTTKPARTGITSNDEFIVPKNIYEEELNKYTKSSPEYIELSKFKPNTWYKHIYRNTTMKEFLWNYKNSDKKFENLEQLISFLENPKDKNIKIKNVNIGANDWEKELGITDNGGKEELLIVFNSVDADAGRSDDGLNGAIKKALGIKIWNNYAYMAPGVYFKREIENNQLAKLNKIIVISICGNYASASYKSNLKKITDNISEKIKDIYNYLKSFPNDKKIKIIAHAVGTGGFAFHSENFKKEEYIKQMMLAQTTAHIKGIRNLKKMDIKVELILNNFKGELEKY